MADAKPDDPLILPMREGYDQWAAIYDTDGNPLVALEEPCVDELMGDVRGLAVLDVGCGTGRHAVRLALAGARVTGIDFSEGMLVRAREKAARAGMDAGRLMFLAHDLARALPFDDASFDRVVCGLVIDHIADLKGLFSEMRRVCRAGGWAVVSVMHPAMMLKGVQARFWEPESGREIRPASCPNQMSDYVMAAVRAGLKIETMRELMVDEGLAGKLERARKYLGWPVVLVMRVLKDEG